MIRRDRQILIPASARLAGLCSTGGRIEVTLTDSSGRWWRVAFESHTHAKQVLGNMCDAVTDMPAARLDRDVAEDVEADLAHPVRLPARPSLEVVR